LQRGVLQDVHGPDDREDAEGEGDDADADVVGDDRRGSDRRLLVQLFPPTLVVFDLLNRGSRQVSEIGEIVVTPGREERRDRDGHEDQKDRQRVAERLPEDRRKIVKVEVQYRPPALRFGAVDHPVGANDQIVQVVDQSLVARFNPGNRQIGGRAPVPSRQFAHLVAAQAAQPAHRAGLINQLFQPLPVGFAFFDKVFSH
jgi:hypothetical protein